MVHMVRLCRCPVAATDDVLDDLLAPSWGSEVDGTLTTEHAASSFGLPVLVVDGVAMGPADLGAHELFVAPVYDVPAGAHSPHVWMASHEEVALARRVAQAAVDAGYTARAGDAYCGLPRAVV